MTRCFLANFTKRYGTRVSGSGVIITPRVNSGGNARPRDTPAFGFESQKSRRENLAFEVMSLLARTIAISPCSTRSETYARLVVALDITPLFSRTTIANTFRSYLADFTTRPPRGNRDVTRYRSVPVCRFCRIASCAFGAGRTRTRISVTRVCRDPLDAVSRRQQPSPVAVDR